MVVVSINSRAAFLVALYFSIFFVQTSSASSFGCPFSSRAGKFQKSQESDSALNIADQFTLQVYAENKLRLLNQTLQKWPYIVAADNITLHREDGSVESVNVISNRYSDLKMVCHTAFTALILMDPTLFDQPDNDTQYNISSADLSRIKYYSGLLTSVLTSLPTCCAWDGDLLQRQQTIVKTVQSFLMNAINHQSVSLQDLNQMAQETVALINQNIYDAVFDLLDRVHAQSLLWKDSLSDDEWDNLQVIIMSSHMPRHGQLFMLYYSSLLNSPVESGLRVVYAEGIQNETNALDLWGSHLIDFTAGRAFWNDPDHMHWDIQYNATEQYINQHKLNHDILEL